VAFWVVHIIMIAFLVSSAWAAQVRFTRSFCYATCTGLHVCDN
jgi:hypothetical protein